MMKGHVYIIKHTFKVIQSYKFVLILNHFSIIMYIYAENAFYQSLSGVIVIDLRYPSKYFINL